MSRLSVEIQLPEFDSVLERLGKGNKLPYTEAAVREAAHLLQSTWVEYASGVNVSYSGGTFRVGIQTGDYVRSIQNGLRFPDSMTGEVFSTSSHGESIESGQDSRDLKPKLLASPKAKTGKNGKKYITVPFRHGAPGAANNAMPGHIYDQARRLTFSRVSSNLPTRTYDWGGRIKEDNTGQRSQAGAHPGAGNSWKAGPYQGMVRMNKQGQTQYMTFRRLSENSPAAAWRRPPTKPKPIRNAVIENTRDQIEEMISQGFQQDMAATGLGGN